MDIIKVRRVNDTYIITTIDNEEMKVPVSSLDETGVAVANWLQQPTHVLDLDIELESSQVDKIKSLNKEYKHVLKHLANIEIESIGRVKSTTSNLNRLQILYKHINTSATIRLLDDTEIRVTKEQLFKIIDKIELQHLIAERTRWKLEKEVIDTVTQEELDKIRFTLPEVDENTLKLLD